MTRASTWTPGQTITRREVLHGRLWMDHPVTVVADDGDVFAVRLDLIVHPDWSREWKDVEDLHHQRAEGRIDLETVGLVLEESARVIDLLDADERWWAAFDDWSPSP